MRSLMIAPCLLLGLVVLASGLRSVEPSPCPPPEKPPDPLSARLVAKKRTYVLDRQGMTAAKYRKAIESGTISPPEVDLVLELTNNTKTAMRIRITGTVPTLILELKGKDSIVSRSTVDGVRERITYVVLEPGKKHLLPIKTLAGFAKGTQRQQLFWTEPGEYTLGASYQTSCYEVEAGGVGVAKGKGRRLTRHKATADPITITVKLK
jgi:hypothetical protein